MPAMTIRAAASGEPISASGRSARLATIVTLLLAAAVLAGCTITIGRRDTVDPARVSASITRWLKEQFPDLRVGSIACPSQVKLTAGRTFECTADVEGAQLPITVTLTHVDTDKGVYDSSFKLAKALVNTDKAVKELQSSLPVELVDATVDCGTRVRVVEVGGSIECTISKGNERHAVRVVVEDVSGSAHFELVDQPPPTRPEVATGKIGDKLTIYDEFGDAQLEVTVTRVKFTRGDEIEQPRRGLYMGAFVKARAFADEQFFDLYAQAGGHLYEVTITAASGFDPQLELIPLNTGERESGWLIFDVPARHGKLVLRDLEERTLATWTY